MISRLFFLVSWFPDLVFFSCAPPFIREAPASLLLSRLMPVRLGPVHLARPLLTRFLIRFRRLFANLRTSVSICD